MKDVVDDGSRLFLLLLALVLAREGGAFGRVAVRKGGVAVVKCQFPGEWVVIQLSRLPSLQLL